MIKEDFTSYCDALLTEAKPGCKVLVTGASGYIGGVLIPVLLARGYYVKVMVRNNKAAYQSRWPDAEIVVADVLNYTQLAKSIKGVEVAYYFIHSLKRNSEFTNLDSYGAINFRKAAEENNLKRIIYLSSLGDVNESLSRHLKSRIQTAKLLSEGKVPVTVLRAAVIIGAGSASYDIIYHLVKYCPIFVLPSWAKSMCQPISIRDVVAYLVGCMESDASAGLTLDIGGKDVLSYKDILVIQSRILKKKRIFIPSGINGVSLYAFISRFFTPVSYKLTRVLMESCVNNVVCENDEIRKIIPIQTLSYEESLREIRSQDIRKFHKKEKRLKPNRRDKKGMKNLVPLPPLRSKNIFTDLFLFLLLKPNTPTLVRLRSMKEKEDYSLRLLQRLNVDVKKFRILNVHQIGIDAPAKYVFDELLKWDGDSTCWPNHLAKIVRKENKLDHLLIYLFGWKKISSWINPFNKMKKFPPLFKMDVINIQKTPIQIDGDNARYLLYKCSGGYPIGIFTMYVRSSIKKLQEQHQSQLFLVVGFNFYGRENLSQMKMINKLWESIHNRVTAHVLNKIKQLSEWRFNSIQTDDRLSPK